MSETPRALEDYREAIQLLRRLADVHWGTPAPDETIKQAEAALGVAFPASLRAFIAEVGSCQIAHREILGIRGDAFSTEYAANVVGASLLERSWGLSPSRIVVENPGDGTRIVVDVARAGRVWKWVRRDTADHDTTWDFDSFGAMLLQAALDQAEEEGVAYEAGVR